MFKWILKQFNKKIEITEKLKLDQNTITKVELKHKTLLQKYTKNYNKKERLILFIYQIFSSTLYAFENMRSVDFVLSCLLTY